MDTDEIKARLLILPTRDELEKMFSAYVTKEVFNIQFDMLRQEIRELKEQPANHRAAWAWALGIAVSVIAIAGFLGSHLSWN